MTNLLESVDQVTEFLNRGFVALVLFLDFAKAFDKVPHRALMYKLRTLGFDENLLGWIEDFLTNRRQRVVLGAVTSGWLDVLSGVPQGSVLGPLLFVTFINDLPKSVVNCICRLFADDTKLIAAVRNNTDITLIQADLDALVKWSQDWLMEFNTDKCKYMLIGQSSRTKRNHLAQLTMESKPDGKRITLERTKCERDLGIMVNENLSWNEQVTTSANKANVVLGQLRRAFKYWTVNTCRKLYTALVMPHLEYASPV